MEKIIARQLIKKADTAEIVGYELLVQSDEESLYNVSADSAAANAMTAFLTENSGRIFNDRKTVYDIHAFFTVSEYSEDL